MGVTVRLESALDLVKKMEREKERHWREPRDESILKKFPNLQGRFCINLHFIKFVGQNPIN